jgi:hypothetical protein
VGIGEEVNPPETTAIYPNRIKDKARVEAMGFPEFGSDMKLRTRSGTLISRGYVRVVYGDHGPYIEMLRGQVNWEAFECERKGKGYYDKWFSKDASHIMLYDQKRDVGHLPNPPAGKYSYRGYRTEGYADYRVGRAYVDPEDVVIERKERESEQAN